MEPVCGPWSWALAVFFVAPFPILAMFMTKLFLCLYHPVIPRVVRSLLFLFLLAPSFWMVIHPDRYRFNPYLLQQIPLEAGLDNLLLLVFLALFPLFLAGLLRYRGFHRLSLVALLLYPLLGWFLIQAEGWFGAPGMGHDALFPAPFLHELLTIFRSTEELEQLGKLWLQRVVRGPVPESWVESWLAQAVTESAGSLDRFRINLESVAELGNVVAQMLIQAELITLQRQQSFALFLAWTLPTLYFSPTSLVSIVMFRLAMLSGYISFEDIIHSTVGEQDPPLKMPDPAVPGSKFLGPKTLPDWAKNLPNIKYPPAPQLPPRPSLPQKFFFPRSWGDEG